MTQEPIMEKSKDSMTMSLRSILISTTLGHMGYYCP